MDVDVAARHVRGAGVKRYALWIVGPPAAGKTTLTRSYLGDLAACVLVPAPKWTVAVDGAVVAAGHYAGETFDGADRVPYSGAAAALEYWATELRERAELTIFDGDRFSYAAAVEFMRRHVDECAAVYVDASPDVLAARRAERVGWSPNAAWLKGRETKARRFAEAFACAT